MLICNKVHVLKVKVSTPPRAPAGSTRPAPLHARLQLASTRQSARSCVVVVRSSSLTQPHVLPAPNSRGGLHYSLNARYAPRISSTELRRARPSRAARLEAAPRTRQSSCSGLATGLGLGLGLG